MCNPSAAAQSSVSRSPQFAPSGPAPGEQHHPDQAQDDGQEDLPREVGPEEEPVGEWREDDEEPGDEAGVRGRGEEQAHRLEEVGRREHHAYAAADEQRPARKLSRVDRGERGPGQDEAGRQETG